MKKVFRHPAVGIVLLMLALIILVFASRYANAVEVTIAPKRAALPPAPVLAACSPFTAFGTPCMWYGGIEIPIMSTGPSRFQTMVTLVLPPTNPDWDLYQGNLDFSLDFVYKKECKNLVTYKNTAWLYKNDDVCR